MKTTILALTALAVTVASTPRATGGDREWATAGKVLTGVVAGSLLLRALEPRPVVTTTYVYPTPTVLAPAPVVVQTVAPPPPGTVYVQPAPVYYAAPAPVYYAAPAPVCVQTVTVCPPPPRVYLAPPPGFYVNVGYARGYHPRPHRVVRW